MSDECPKRSNDCQQRDRFPTAAGQDRIGHVRRQRRLAAAALLCATVAASPAAALLPFPEPLPTAPTAPPPPPPPPPPPVTEHGLEAAPRVTAIATPVPSTAGAPIPIGGISFNVIDRSQKVRLTRQRAGGVSLPDAVAHDDSRSYLAGLDLAVGACSLAPFKCSGIDFSNAFMAAIVQGAAGYTEDTTSVNGTGTSTEGPTLSIGTQLNVTTPAWSASPTLPPFRLFAAASFDFTNTSFRKVEGWSSAYRVEPTVGAVLGYQLYLYAGTGWEYLTPSVSTTVSVQGTQVPFRFRTEEEDPWSGVVGLIYRNALAPILLPGFDLIFEGDVGGRTSFQFSLRREIAIGG